MIKAAIIGCGRIASLHAYAYKNLKNAKLIAAVEINKKRKKIFEQKFGIPVYTSIHKLIKNHNIDLASITTPPYLHYKIALELMKKNINLIIEKPVCLNNIEGRRLLEEEKKSKVIVSTCFQFRFNPVIKWLFNIIKKRKLGKIFLINLCLRWFRDRQYFKDEWRRKKEKIGGGVLMTHAIHLIDLLRKIVGSDSLLEIKGFASNVRKYGDIEEVVIANFKYKSNLLVNLEASILSYPKDFETSITIIGQRGTIKIGGKSLNKIEYAYVQNTSIPKSLIVNNMKNKPYNNHMMLIKNVLEAIKRKKKPEVQLIDGVEAVRFINNIYSSIKLYK